MYGNAEIGRFRIRHATAYALGLSHSGLSSQTAVEMSQFTVIQSFVVPRALAHQRNKMHILTRGLEKTRLCGTGLNYGYAHFFIQLPGLRDFNKCNFGLTSDLRCLTEK